jgi:hypothetical protein
MLLEAKGQWQAADEAYDALLAAEPGWEAAHKRKVALLRRVEMRLHPRSRRAPV